jgi:hypothetical protein
MPYIKEELRDKLDDSIEQLLEDLYYKVPSEELDGVLNYTLTRILVGAHQRHTDTVRYKSINSMMGTLECMKQELYRKVAVWYEELAELKNGKVAELDKWGKWV